MKTFRAKRRLVQIPSALIFVGLPFTNLLRLDIPTFRFYFLNTILWIDEFFLLLLAFFLILSVLVLLTLVYGRVWSGWMCPQTILNEFHRWLSLLLRRHLIQQDKRKKREIRTLWYRLLLVAGTGASSFIIGFTIVGYFADPRRMLQSTIAGDFDSSVFVVVLLLSGLVAADVLFLRERFCRSVCPYGLLQTVVMDERSQIVRFDRARADECIDCRACVKSCIMKVDIRDARQEPECIHCGDCVDACEAALAPHGKSTLIRFFRQPTREAGRFAAWNAVLDPKRWFAVSLVSIFGVALAAGLQLRHPLVVTVVREPVELFRVGEDGIVYNSFTLRLTNRTQKEEHYSVALKPAPREDERLMLRIEGDPPIVGRGETKPIRFSVSAAGLPPGPHTVKLVVECLSCRHARAETDLVIFIPELTTPIVPLPDRK